MAISENVTKRALVISLDDGATSTGAQKVKNRTFNNIKASVTADAIYAVGAALASLMQRSLVSVGISEKTELVTED